MSSVYFHTHRILILNDPAIKISMKWLESCVDFGVLKDLTDSHNSQEPMFEITHPLAKSK